MRIVFLAGCNSIHTVKWVNEMANRGHDVHLVTIHHGTEEIDEKVRVHKLPFNPPGGYYINLWHFKKIIKAIKPDLLNTHYASGYGTLARLSGFQPNFLSVWGSDVFDYPYKSMINMRIIKRNLKAATQIASTSYIMKKQVESIYKPKKDIVVTPFGVDSKKFKPMVVEKDKNRIIIGTVKKLAPKYGISTLIKAFALVKNQIIENIELVLVGGGPQEEELKILVKKLKINNFVRFIGNVPHGEVPKWLNKFDIYGALSENDSESFGVAIIEASSCGLPVVVSDAGGLPEVVEDGKTGFIVPRNNPKAAAEMFIKLIKDRDLRETMGKAGRKFVLEKYNWVKCADIMEKLYEEVLREYRERG
jgi:glycosyltransferase involved in cell wall biosynthesis